LPIPLCDLDELPSDTEMPVWQFNASAGFQEPVILDEGKMCIAGEQNFHLPVQGCTITKLPIRAILQRFSAVE